ncbi:hypothetical protein [Lambdina fiscellaria nucleopolyhedrovirus]|uniref:Uncharacterized protein n=1 Tax=Lambdina fiscellaria nucleopolyhedrovirus TaxID=1642929 RepID=A0A0E3URC5_9ABAC|nr:hypothetical protein [Lambdina fiscellaria nucleopolyhedrovirus]AKC91720.1 hypothetical protein [Lambdina fiscellaria nucleopolyhedrovirus]
MNSKRKSVTGAFRKNVNTNEEKSSKQSKKNKTNAGAVAHLIDTSANAVKPTTDAAAPTPVFVNASADNIIDFNNEQSDPTNENVASPISSSSADYLTSADVASKKHKLSKNPLQLLKNIINKPSAQTIAVNSDVVADSTSMNFNNELPLYPESVGSLTTTTTPPSAISKKTPEYYNNSDDDDDNDIYNDNQNFTNRYYKENNEGPAAKRPDIRSNEKNETRSDVAVGGGGGASSLSSPSFFRTNNSNSNEMYKENQRFSNRFTRSRDENEGKNKRTADGAPTTTSLERAPSPIIVHVAAPMLTPLSHFAYNDVHHIQHNIDQLKRYLRKSLQFPKDYPLQSLYLYSNGYSADKLDFKDLMIHLLMCPVKKQNFNNFFAMIRSLYSNFTQNLSALTETTVNVNYSVGQSRLHELLTTFVNACVNRYSEQFTVAIKSYCNANAASDSVFSTATKKLLLFRINQTHEKLTNAFNSKMIALESQTFYKYTDNNDVNQRSNFNTYHNINGKRELYPAKIKVKIVKINLVI